VRILLIEDNPGDADLVIEYLEEARGSYDIECAKSLSEARELCLREAFELALLDLGLSDSQGLETVVSAQTFLAGTPFVVVTGCNDTEIGIKAVQLGAQDFLSKGRFSPELLERCLRYSLERHRLTLERQAFEEENRRLIQSLEKERRHDELNTLAAGLGHEINNPLACIRMEAELLLEESHNPEIRECAQSIVHNSRRISAVVKKLDYLTSPETERSENVSLVDLLNSAWLRARSSWSDDLPALQIRVPENTEIVCSPFQTERLFAGLLKNCLEALQSCPDGRIIVWATQLGQAVSVTVVDNGPGVLEEHKDRLLEPFFTTKNRTQDMGLGLTLARKSMLNLGGHWPWRVSREAVLRWT
jgi:C4-dicarboxylate-specific signal transduction histidine kinase